MELSIDFFLEFRQLFWILCQDVRTISQCVTGRIESCDHEGKKVLRYLLKSLKTCSIPLLDQKQIQKIPTPKFNFFSYLVCFMSMPVSSDLTVLSSVKHSSIRRTKSLRSILFFWRYSIMAPTWCLSQKNGFTNLSSNLLKTEAMNPSVFSPTFLNS